MERYDTSSDWFIKLVPVNANDAPAGLGRAYSRNNKIVVTIPEGALPS